VTRRALAVRLGLGVVLLAFTMGAAIPGPQPHHIRVCFLSTTTEEPSCATIREQYEQP
jgi:hypothetical protein